MIVPRVRARSPDDLTPRLGTDTPASARLLAIAVAVAVGAAAGVTPAVGVTAATALLLAAVFALRPDWATLVVVAVLYSNAAVVAVTVHGVPGFVSALVPLVLLIPFMHLVLVRREPIVFTPAMPWMVGYLIASFVSAVLSIDRPFSLAQVMTFVTEGFCLYFAMSNVVRTETLLRRIIWVLVLVGGGLGLLSIVQTATGTYSNNYGGFAQNSEVKLEALQRDVFQELGPPRLGGPVGKKNRYGQILVALLPIGLMRVRDERRSTLRILAVLLTLLIAAGIMLTYSRGAAIAVALTLLVMTAMGCIRPILLIACGVGIWLLLQAFPGYGERLATIESVDALVDEDGGASAADGSIRGRVSSSLGALLVFQDHPILGVGPGLYPVYHRAKAFEIGLRVQEYRQPHSLLPHIAAEYGGIGLTCFLAILFVTLRDLRRARRRWRRDQPQLASLVTSLTLAIVAYHGAGLFLSFAYERYYWLLLAVAAAAAKVVKPDDVTAASRVRIRRGASGAVAG